MTRTNPPPSRVESLDLTDQAAGTRRDLWLTLGHDTLGEPLAVPVSVLRGQQDGPVVGLTAALHGDELNGIGVLHALLSEIDPGRLRGSIVAVLVANVPGFLAGSRRYVDGYDLNHVMPGQPEGKEAEVYAHRLLTRALAPCELLFDLHTASLDRTNSYYVRADLGQPETAALAWRQQPSIILHAPASSTTLRGAFADAGKPAITLEIGDPRAWQPPMIERAVAGLRSNLAALHMIDAPRADGAHPSPVVCASSRWLRSEQGGLARILPGLGQRVSAGARVAELYDVFGRPLSTLLAPEDGVVIGRAISPALRSAGRLLHLGKPAEAGELPAMDAWLEASGRGRPSR